MEGSSRRSSLKCHASWSDCSSCRSLRKNGTCKWTGDWRQKPLALFVSVQAGRTLTAPDKARADAWTKVRGMSVIATFGFSHLPSSPNLQAIATPILHALPSPLEESPTLLNPVQHVRKGCRGRCCATVGRFCTMSLQQARCLGLILVSFVGHGMNFKPQAFAFDLSTSPLD